MREYSSSGGMSIGMTMRFSADSANDLIVRGPKDGSGPVEVLFSNSDCPAVRQLYRGFHLTKVWARRRINKDGSKRHAISELLIRNY